MLEFVRNYESTTPFGNVRRIPQSGKDEMADNDEEMKIEQEESAQDGETVAATDAGTEEPAVAETANAEESEFAAESEEAEADTAEAVAADVAAEEPAIADANGVAEETRAKKEKKARKGASKFIEGVRKVEQSTIVRTVRSGLVNMIPVLIIGAFALIIKTFPIDGYQKFITTFGDGVIYSLFDLIYAATFGVLSVYMTFSISRSFMKSKADPHVVHGGATIASLLAFFILAGAYLPTFSTDSLGPKSVFLAIITGLGASALYLAFDKLFRRRKRTILTPGADREFNRMLTTFFPILCVALVFAVINQLVISIFDRDSFRALLIEAFDTMFAHIPNGFFKGFFFVFLSSFLWFFGIHGSDTLEAVMQAQFVPGLAANQAAVAAGGAPEAILTKEFFDCFVLMGGCGAAICLLIAILIFSRNRAHRSLGYTAAFPMIFNINELMVFGLPIILNPIMLIPFMTVPLVCYSVAYLAISMGWVPMITSEVAWTTPIILGGLRATGSYTGALLQVVNIVLGVAIYVPFVKILDKRSTDRLKQNYAEFLDYFRANEADLATVKITALSNMYGDVAKALCADIKHGLKDKVTLAYQPQYDYEGNCIGVEALLRYKHPLHGVIYPPLVIKLAEDGDFLPDLEEAVLRSALADRDKIIERFGEGIKLSVNVTGTTIVTTRFLQFCRKLNEENQLGNLNLCLEITEQAALSFNDGSMAILDSLKEMGVTFAIDDFSMGKTSINYLKDNIFAEINLDGSLVKGLFTHQNCREIIQSITSLASTLNLQVMAEYVETEEERVVLHEIGCDCYQGWLYSPAVFLDK